MTDSRKSKAGGFTLIELLITLVIIGLLAGLVVPRIINILDATKHNSLKPKITMIQGAIERFYLETGRYPAQLEELAIRPANVDFWMGPYLELDQLDGPWGKRVAYVFPGQHRDFELIFYGKDGVPGGKDVNADVANYTPTQG